MSNCSLTPSSNDASNGSLVKILCLKTKNLNNWIYSIPI